MKLDLTGKGVPVTVATLAMAPEPSAVIETI